MVAPARQIATRVLHRVLHDEAWAAPTLDAELRRTSVERADAALGTQIVYGTLRVVPELERSLARHAKRTLKLDDWSRAALLGGVFQLLHLGRVPSHAIVNDTVELVRIKRGARVAGFANAILRKLAHDRPEAPVPPASVCVPDRLNDALVASLGAEQARRLLEVGAEQPSVDLRIGVAGNRRALARDIETHRPGAEVSLTAISHLGLRVSGAGDPRELPGYAEGRFAVQEEGAQLIGLLLGAKPGERVLDVCAGRGGKTAQLLEAVLPNGHVIATDVHEHRLEQIPGEMKRLQLDVSRLDTACVDWSVGPGSVDGGFDRVLVDAPCTGLGTLRRRPEILLRFSPGDAARMGEMQRSILGQAARMVKPGGTLLYAVCSPLPEEGLEVVGSLDRRGFELQRDCASHLKSLHFGSDGRLSLGPWVAGAGPWADAYQVYMWVNVG